MIQLLEEFPLPNHYNPQNTTDEKYTANPNLLQKSANDWKNQNYSKNFSFDTKSIHLLIIDDQIDFSFPTGALYVAGRSGTGAVDAQKNLVEFIYRHIHIISKITCTLDTHSIYQIFFPTAHLDFNGDHPTAHTNISADEYKKGIYRPNPLIAKILNVDISWLTKQFIYYCEQLEFSDKYGLYLWPYHCLLGSNGHRLSGVVEEAYLFHGFVNKAENSIMLKGENLLTEHYSVFSPEVVTCWDGTPILERRENFDFIKKLLKADAVIIAGLASSHCVKSSIEDLLKEIKKTDYSFAKKIYILSDCIAPVVISGGYDFTDNAEKALENFHNEGMHIVKSTIPIVEWPNISDVLKS